MKTDLTRRALLAGAGAAAVAQSPKKAVRIGIVGGGFGSTFQWHLDPDCEVAAVCDIRPDRLDRLAAVYRCSNTYKDYRSMLKHPGLNAVAVKTPAPLHAWMCVEAMKAGKHVISAVPAGMAVASPSIVIEVISAVPLRLSMSNTQE